MVRENALNIYTDGSSFSRPRRGGAAFRFVTVNKDGNDEIEDIVLPGRAGATNNEMELLACIEALERARGHPSVEEVERVIVYTDSLYVKENWLRAEFWKRQGWENRDGKPIANADLWDRLIKARRKVPRRLDFQWVKGHAKNIHNKAVDKLAKQSAKGVLLSPLKVTTVRRKMTALSVDPGCVQMRGQQMVVRIVSDHFMRKQKIYKYKYVVLSPGVDVGKVDLIFSVILLRAGHHYEIQVNDDSKNPRIVNLVGEIEKSEDLPLQRS